MAQKMDRFFCAVDGAYVRQNGGRSRAITHMTGEAEVAQLISQYGSQIVQEDGSVCMIGQTPVVLRVKRPEMTRVCTKHHNENLRMVADLPQNEQKGTDDEGIQSSDASSDEENVTLSPAEVEKQKLEAWLASHLGTNWRAGLYNMKKKETRLQARVDDLKAKIKRLKESPSVQQTADIIHDRDRLRAECDRLAEKARKSQNTIKDLRNELEDLEAQLEEAQNKDSSDNSECDLTDESDGEEGTSSRTQQITPTLRTTKISGKYDRVYLQEFARIAVEHGISTNKLPALANEILATHLVNPFHVPPVPSPSLVAQVLRLMGHHLKHNSGVNVNHSLLSATLDEGTFARDSHLSLFVSFLDDTGESRGAKVGPLLLTDGSSQEQCNTLLRAFSERDLPILRLWCITGDRASPNIAAARTVLANVRRQVFNEEKAAGWMEAPGPYGSHYWCKSGDCSYLPFRIPIATHHVPDVIHLMVRAEENTCNSIFTPLEFPDVNKGKPMRGPGREVALAFGRLFNENRGLLDVLRAKVARLGIPAPGYIPAAVGHRLNIVPKLAMTCYVYHLAIIELLEEEELIGHGSSHITDVLVPFKQYPELLTQFGLLSRLLDVEAAIYQTVQEEGGFILYRVRSLLLSLQQWLFALPFQIQPSIPLQLSIDFYHGIWAFVERNYSVVLTEFPLRIATYWDPLHGFATLALDAHCLGECTLDCKLCLENVPRWTETPMQQCRANSLGFWFEPAYLGAVKELLHRGSLWSVPSGVWTMKERYFGRDPDNYTDSLPDLPVLHPTLQWFYTTYFAPIQVHSMDCERDLFRIKKTLPLGTASDRVSDEHIRARTQNLNHCSLTTPSVERELLAEDCERRKLLGERKRKYGVVDKAGHIEKHDQQVQSALERREELSQKHNSLLPIFDFLDLDPNGFIPVTRELILMILPRGDRSVSVHDPATGTTKRKSTLDVLIPHAVDLIRSKKAIHPSQEELDEYKAPYIERHQQKKQKRTAH